jgi:shikimate dehydrogenase
VTSYVGLIGYPLGHSVSPAFQQAAIDHYGLDMRYERWETPPDQVPAFVETLRSGDRVGSNVTVPHKQAVVPLLDALDAAAAAIGAVNTIVRQVDGRLVGYNTDCTGFVRALREQAGFDPAGANVLLLGAGGAARAVVYALLKAEATTLGVANRTPARAEALTESFARLAAEQAAALYTVEEDTPHFDEALRQANLVVNATSIGMWHGPAEGRSPLEGRTLRPGMLVYDLVYNPEQTPLLIQAQQAGCPTLGGLAMLVYQGAEAFELWTGKPAPIDVMFAAARRALRGD